MAYLGNDLQVAYPSYKNIDDISGSFNSSTTSFPLRVNGAAPVPLPLNSQQCLISVGGVVQRPDDSGSEGFRLSGGNIIFASAPTTGADFFGVILAGADYVNVGAHFPSGSAAVPSITFDSDLDTGLFNSAANEIAFSTGGTQRLTVSSAGQLSNNLGSASAPSYSFTGDVNTGIYSPGADQVAISTGGSGRLFVDSSGRIGVGVSSPGYPLDLVSQSGESIRVRGTSGTEVSKLLFTSNNAGADYGFLSSASSYLAFGTATTERMRLTSTGLGIGTTSPSKNVEIAASADPAIRLNDTRGYTSDILQAGSGLVLRNNDASGPIIFKAGGDTERARIDSSGRLLVGTSTARSGFQLSTGFGNVTPVHQFEFNSQTYNGLSITHNAGANTYPAVLAFGKSRGSSAGSYTAVASGDGLGWLDFYGADGTNMVRAATISAEVDGTPGTNDMPGRLVFSTTADGASSPTTRVIIDNAGRVRAQGVYDNTTVAAANVWVDTDGSLRRSTSSIKYKTSVETLEDSYADAILEVRPVWYKSLSPADNPDHGWWGFIAEEVAQIDPRLVQWKTSETKPDESGSLVSTDLDQPEPEGVMYDRFVPHLLNLIKRQKEQIEAMEARLSALEAQ